MKPKTGTQKRSIEARAKRAVARQLQNESMKMQVERAAIIPDVMEEEEQVGPLLERNELLALFHKSTQANLRDTRTSRIDPDSYSFADMLTENSRDKACQVDFQESTTECDRENLHKLVNLSHIMNSDEKLFTFTGIHSRELLKGLVECCSDLIIDSSTNKMVLPLEERIILTMTKIKLNISFSAIGVLFNVTRQTACKYFKNMCPILARVLNTMISWPNQDIIRSNLPVSFANFKSTRIILDCVETVVEKCKCLRCRILTYSQYKKNHTLKFEVGVTPSGLITHISPTFGGRASDKHIVNESGILDSLDCNDAVMVDKGYRIENECLERRLRLIRPPFLKSQDRRQLSYEDALQTAEIARARVHVERVIQRIREFSFMRGPVPWELVQYFDECLSIVGGLTNLGAPIMNIDKFM